MQCWTEPDTTLSTVAADEMRACWCLSALGSDLAMMRQQSGSMKKMAIRKREFCRRRSHI